MSEPVPLSVTLGELMAQMETPPVRHPVVRSGEREPIPWFVRLSVYERDGHSCRLCGYPSPQLELDHIVPWSAGGSDATSNLRTLCHDCNQERSNFRDVAEERLPVPTTWWCWHCWRDPDIEVNDPDLCDWNEPSRFRSVWKDGTNLTAAPYVTGQDILAYCATCRTYSNSNIALMGSMQQKLIALCAPVEPPSSPQEASA